MIKIKKETSIISLFLLAFSLYLLGFINIDDYILQHNKTKSLDLFGNTLLELQNVNNFENMTSINVYGDYFKNLKSSIEELIGEENIDSVGVTVHDLTTNTRISINGDKEFIAASTYKVPLSIVIYDKINKGEIDKDETMYFQEQDWEDGYGFLENSPLLYSPLKIEDLLEYSLRYSDNVSSKMLYRRLGGYSSMRKEFDKILGYETNGSENVLTPNIAADALLILHSGDNPYFKTILNHLNNTSFDDRIAKYIPNELVHHKIGNYLGAINDIGIVYSKNPFIISVYTYDVPNSHDLIADISKLVYDQQENMNF